MEKYVLCIPENVLVIRKNRKGALLDFWDIFKKEKETIVFFTLFRNKLIF